MGINEFFDAIAKVGNRFAEETAEERLQEKEKSVGGPKVRAEKTEKEGGKKKEIYRDFPKTG